MQMVVHFIPGHNMLPQISTKNRSQWPNHVESKMEEILVNRLGYFGNMGAF